MKSRVVVVVLAVIGMFALSVTAAQAGGGAGAASFNTFFVCTSISNAENVGEVVSTHEFDDLDTLIHANVKVMAGIMKCRQVNVKNAAGVLINGDLSATELKCYSVSVKGPKAASEAIVLADDFSSSDAVSVSPSPEVLCGPTTSTTIP